MAMLNEMKEFIARGIRHPAFMNTELRERMTLLYRQHVYQSNAIALRILRDERVYGLSLLEVTQDEARRLIHAEIEWLLPGMVTRIPRVLIAYFDNDGERHDRYVEDALAVKAGLEVTADWHHTVQAFEAQEPDAQVMGRSQDPNWYLVRKRDPFGILTEMRRSGARNPIMFKDRPSDRYEDLMDEDSIVGEALLPVEYHLLLDMRAAAYKRQMKTLPPSRGDIGDGLVNLQLAKVKAAPASITSRTPFIREVILPTDLGLRFMGVKDANLRNAILTGYR
ncbi:hypothetical protein CcrC1_gp289 [Caulobacter phage C1]|nr:hypothetical protein CcrC1_gp289 [Caulobacter phage C1]UTU08518.1 hypothetical protein CcrC2_gp290 [Caulobacter phage C2]UTU09034.1 hypothetical protein CcrJ4_gp285 [Caulobacter phage J4]UTU10151.1 hypothetical protein CcrRB23_gp289 [Caulobacter phage RB23]WGN97185.1 hypothetical protein [Bertelyvirus sp.]